MVSIKLEYFGLTEEEVRKLSLAHVHLAKAINSLKFKEFVLNFKYQYWYSYRYTVGIFWRKKNHSFQFNGFASTNLTNPEVYDLIMSGKEKLDPTADQEADIFLRVDRKNRRGVIGYTYPNTPFQYIYSWVLKKYTPEQIAGNLFHEWLHKVGFNHDFKATRNRPYSVPYACGKFVTDYKD